MSLECYKNRCRFCLQSEFEDGDLQSITKASLDMFTEITQTSFSNRIGMPKLICSSCKSNFGMFLNFKRRMIDNQKKLIDMADQSVIRSVRNRLSTTTTTTKGKEASPINRISNEGVENPVSTIARPCPVTRTQTLASPMLLKLRLNKDTGKVVVEHTDGTLHVYSIAGQNPLTSTQSVASSPMVKVSTHFQKPATQQPKVILKRKSADGNATLSNKILRKKIPNAQQAPPKAPPIVQSVESHEEVPIKCIKLSNPIKNLRTKSSKEPPSKSK